MMMPYEFCIIFELSENIGLRSLQWIYKVLQNLFECTNNFKEESSEVSPQERVNETTVASPSSPKNTLEIESS